MAVHQGKSKALSSQPSAARRTKILRPKTKRAGRARLERRGRQLFRFREAVGKTVEFVEICTSADFPCIDIGFTDKTALLFLIEARLSMEPTYSDWTTGNQRVLTRWPPRETD